MHDSFLDKALLLNEEAQPYATAFIVRSFPLSPPGERVLPYFSEARQKGVTMDQLKKVRTPAGIDIGAKLPEEVAVSIFAEIIQAFRENVENAGKDVTENPSAMPNDEYYINPVCNIPVQKSSARHILEYKSEKVYFCCDGCKVSFEKDPEKYMAKLEV